MIVIYLFAAILIISFFIYISHSRSKQNTLKKLRSAWGVLPEDRIKLELAKSYSDYKKLIPQESNYPIDDRTWQDLDLDELYYLMNRTISPIGGQYLYHLLRTPRFDQEKLDQREKLISLLSNDKTIREKIQFSLLKLENKNVSYLANLLWGNLPAKPTYAVIFPVLSYLAVLSIILVIFQILPWWILIANFSINVIIRQIAKRKIDDAMISFQHLGNLISCADKITQKKFDCLEEIYTLLKQNLKKVKPVKKRVFSIQLEDSFGLSEYPKIFFLSDLTTFYSALESIKSHILELRNIFEILGLIDSMISIASFRTEHSNFSSPIFSEDKNIFQVDEIFHPILKEPISNDFNFENKSILITGSNMSGKTTFLKTIGANAVLAQTVNMVMAKKYIAPFLQVTSSISRSDSLISGKSYYLAEVESILSLIKASDSKWPQLLLIDEIFRGTNSVERQAASIEVLNYLNGFDNFILVATHDLDLTEILEKKYVNYHFSETLDESGLCFDYKIKSGSSSTRNAIALLEHVGYPQKIVSVAQKRIDESGE